MSGIFWSEGEAAIKDYSALTKAGKTLLTVKIEVTDHYALGYILRELDQALAAKRFSGRSSKSQLPLLLTDQRGRAK